MSMVGEDPNHEQTPGEFKPRLHSVFCNVARFTCDACGKYRSYCLSHREPTQANRCRCHDINCGS